jgi:hypothetical protein
MHTPLNAGPQGAQAFDFRDDPAALEIASHAAVSAAMPSTAPSAAPHAASSVAASSPSPQVLSIARALEKTGTIRDMPALMSHLDSPACAPLARKAVCTTISAIVARRDWMDAAPFLAHRARLESVARTDADAGVRGAARAACASIDQATECVSAWGAVPTPGGGGGACGGDAETGSGGSKRLHRSGDGSPSQPAPPPAPLFLAQAPPTKRSKGPSPRSLGVGPADEPLFHGLVALRTSLADGKQPYLVYSNEVLIALTRARPLTEAALLAVPGIGRKKVDSFGDEIIAVVARHRRASDPAPPERTAPAAPSAPSYAQLDLAPEQRHALGTIVRGESIFLTGGAGTGKSFALKLISALWPRPA